MSNKAYNKKRSRLARKNRKIKTQLLRRRAIAEPLVCHWCQDPLTRENITLDHVIPKSEGGANSTANAVLACQPCNATRGKTMWEAVKAARRSA